MTDLIIVGAGGFGLEVAAYAEDIKEAGIQDLTVKGFLDDTKTAGTLQGGYPILGPTTMPIDTQALYVIAVGNPLSRQALAEKLTRGGAQFTSLFHPTAYIAESAEIGDGCIFAPFSFVGPQARLGNHCLLNIYASAGHECVISDHCALAPYAGTHASSILEESVFLAAHAVVTNGIRIGAGAKLAAGAVAYTDVPPNASALGNPARVRP